MRAEGYTMANILTEHDVGVLSGVEAEEMLKLHARIAENRGRKNGLFIARAALKRDYRNTTGELNKLIKKMEELIEQDRDTLQLISKETTKWDQVNENI